MRLSPRRHVLVLIREELDITQKDLANILDLSNSAMQKIELGKLPLPPRIARKASEEFRVSVSYLTKNDVSKKPVTADGKPLSKEAYDNRRSPWGLLSPEECAWRLRGSEILLRGYLRHRSIVESFENPEIGAELLDICLENALYEFAGKNFKLLKKDGYERFVSKLDSKDSGLETILWDVQEVLKVAKKLPPRSRAIRNNKPLPPMPDPVARDRSRFHALIGQKSRLIKDVKSAKKPKRLPL
jgi:transcriptional regulator with XRE-family HTH domain